MDMQHLCIVIVGLPNECSANLISPYAPGFFFLTWIRGEFFLVLRWHPNEAVHIKEMHLEETESTELVKLNEHLAHTHERNDLLSDYPKAKYFVWSNHLHLFKYLYPIYSLFSESILVRRKIDQDALRFSDLSNHTAAFTQAAVFITLSVHPILNCLIFRNSDASFPP